MNDWSYTFDPVTKAAWFEQIRKDLKGKPVDSLQQEWWPGEPLLPFHHLEDLAGETIALPDSRFQQPPVFAEYLETGSLSAGEINRMILEALRFDAGHVILPIGPAMQMHPEWFEGVHVPIPVWHIETDQIMPELPSPLNGKDITCFQRIRRTSSDTSDVHPFENWTGKSASGDKRFKFEYVFTSGGIWDEEAAKIFNRMLSDARTWRQSGGEPSDFFSSHCILRLEADTDYYKLILQARTLQFVYYNLVSALSVKGLTDPWLECHITPGPDENPDRYLIRSASSSLAASLAGTFLLCIHHLQTPGVPALYRRADRNILNLLAMESSIAQSTDPLAGASAIDYYGRRWTGKIWDRLLF